MGSFALANEEMTEDILKMYRLLDFCLDRNLKDETRDSRSLMALYAVLKYGVDNLDIFDYVKNEELKFNLGYDVNKKLKLPTALEINKRIEEIAKEGEYFVTERDETHNQLLVLRPLDKFTKDWNQKKLTTKDQLEKCFSADNHSYSYLKVRGGDKMLSGEKEQLRYSLVEILIKNAGEISSGLKEAMAKHTPFQDNIRAEQKNKTNSFPAPQTAPVLKVKEQKTEQTNLSIGVRAYSYFDSNYPTLKLLGIILGASMSSRLFIAVRERRGLAYQVHTNVEGYADSGYLTTNIGASADKIEAAVKVVLLEYRRIAKELVSAAELKKAKDYFKGKVALQLESSENMASWFSRQAVLGLPLLTAKEHIEEIMRVSRTDVKRVANQIFQNNGLNLAVIGYRINTGGLTKILKI